MPPRSKSTKARLQNLGKHAQKQPKPLILPTHPTVGNTLHPIPHQTRIQKSRLQELIESRHRICDFYPKYHCELNFIEQYWGAAKCRYRNTPKTSKMDEMKKNVLACLDDVDLLKIRRYDLKYSNISMLMLFRYANWSARFMAAYDLGLLGTKAAWVNKKYHNHRTLPPIWLAYIRHAELDMDGPLYIYAISLTY